MKRDRDLDDTLTNYKVINDSTNNYFEKIDIEIASLIKNEFKKSHGRGPKTLWKFCFY
jgi:hypothetical protein